MKKSHIPLIVLLFFLFFSYSSHSFAANNDWVNINGTVTYNGSPVCTMVLANGQYMFTCSGDGSFNLDVPLDPDTGQITVFAFCEGLAPFEQVIYPAEGHGIQIEMADGEGVLGMDVTYTLTAINTTWVRLEGTVSYNGNPVCAMVLANGQYMFTCSGDGSFNLDVPIDPADGSVTLFGFCGGLPPHKYVFTTIITDPGEMGTSYFYNDFNFVGALNGAELNGQTQSVDVIFSDNKFAVAGKFGIDLWINQSDDMGTWPTSYSSVTGYLFDATGNPLNDTANFTHMGTMPTQIWPGWGHYLLDGTEYLPAATGYSTYYPVNIESSGAYYLDPIIFSGIHFDITFPVTPTSTVMGLRMVLYNWDNPIYVSPDPLPEFYVSVP